MNEPLRVTRQEVLSPGGNEILLFPQPGALISVASKRPDFLGTVEAITKEYLSILEAVSSRFDPARINLVQTDFITGNITFSGRIKYNFSTPPDLQGYKGIKLGGQESRGIEEMVFGERIFLRDLFTNIGGEYFFVDQDASPDVKEEGNVILSPLGEGGKVLSAGKSIIVAQDLWVNPISRKHLDMLRVKGYRVAHIPLVDENSQPEGKREFIKDHIDGHAALLLGDDENLHLLYAKSYARQGGQTSKALRSAADFVGADATEVDDNGLPPLAFNLVQFANGSVVMSSSRGSKSLEERVRAIVGVDKLTVTSIPIVEISALSKGSIRCMANFAPWFFIQRFNPVVTTDLTL